MERGNGDRASVVLSEEGEGGGAGGCNSTGPVLSNPPDGGPTGTLRGDGERLMGPLLPRGPGPARAVTRPPHALPTQTKHPDCVSPCRKWPSGQETKHAFDLLGPVMSHSASPKGLLLLV